MIKMQSVTPTPRTFTLRFKHHRTTLLVEVDPIQNLSGVRTELLQVLQETNSSGELNGHAIPKNPDDILLGRAVDRNNLTLGFTSMNKALGGAGASAGGKGKSAASTPAKAGSNQLKDSPQGLGLRNGDVVAFKFKEDDKEEDEEVAETWDVVIPTMEDTYGDEEAQDEGLGLEED